MAIVLSLMILGFFTGYISLIDPAKLKNIKRQTQLMGIQKKIRAFLRINDKLITWAIYLLLFFLGLSVGGNTELMANLQELGLQALVITGGALIGSIFLAWLLYKFFFKRT